MNDIVDWNILFFCKKTSTLNQYIFLEQTVKSENYFMYVFFYWWKLRNKLSQLNWSQWKEELKFGVCGGSHEKVDTCIVDEIWKV